MSDICMHVEVTSFRAHQLVFFVCGLLLYLYSVTLIFFALIFVDTKKLPLGKLSKLQVMKGFEVGASHLFHSGLSGCEGFVMLGLPDRLSWKLRRSLI